MNPEQQPSQQTNPDNLNAASLTTDKKPSNKAAWIIAVVILIIILAVGGWFIYVMLKNKNKPIQQPQGQSSIQTAEVNITANGFSPATITIKKGDQVVWKNADSKQHRIFAEPYPTKTSLPDLDSDALQPNTSYGFIFENSGTYKYTDYYNPTKFLGVVVVE
jgi:plastocyanin